MSVQLIVDARLSDPNCRAQARQRVVNGLLSPLATVPPTYLYDALGARLFTAITELPEYYLTRTESALLEQCVSQITEMASGISSLVDLGAGDCKKGARLLRRLQPPHYLAVDVSAECLLEAASGLARDVPNTAITAFVTDFASGLRWPDGVCCERPLFFYPGSSIGNFSPEEARTLLRSLSDLCQQATTRGGLLLIGVDLVKPAHLLQAAYDDALGLTACFNLNVLRHLNTLLGADFDVRQFRHRAVVDTRHSRVEMSLVSRRHQVVHWPGGQRRFSEGEAIVTEHSHKYTREAVDSLLRSSGFEPRVQWTDDHGHYLLCLAEALC